VRLFVALDLPDNVRRALGDLMARLKPECRGARWVRPEGMHLTLKFIGETSPQKIDSIRCALAAVRSDRPIEMHFRGLGFFPNERRPRVAWCGVEASPNLARLAADVDSALAPLGIAAETRAFVPHLTLARFNSHQGLEKLVRAAADLKSYDFGSVSNSEFYLYESFLKPSGAEYKRLATFPVGKGASAGGTQ
jgi:RNA 2',3'-cyclic 3'-phosphodiesterase